MRVFHLALLACLLGTPAMADQAPNISPKTGAEAGNLMALSRRVFDIARADNDAHGMITAARLRKKAGLQEQDRAGEDDGGGDHTGEASGLLTWQAMLDEAVKRSVGDETIADLAEDLRAQKSKGVVNGAIYSKARVKPRGKRRYRNIAFAGGRFAEVYSEGRGDANLDMFIYDGSGHLVCSQTDPSNISQCGWTPSFTGPFTVVIENKSDVTASYALMTN
ncbi:MAG: hypothetical protein AAFO61_05585 [Pseudomonadota bacterium]